MYHLVSNRDNKQATTILYRTHYDRDTQGVMGTCKEGSHLLEQGFQERFL